jgi:peptidyl-prolyl cis-trans isomerase C
MKIKAKMIFPAVMAALLLAFPTAHAATANAFTNMAAAGANTNVNLNATMTALFGDPAVAKGKGFEIKQSELDAAMLNVKTAAAARGQTIPPQQTKNIEISLLDQLVDRRLLLQKATAADKAEGQQDFEKFLQELKTRGKFTNDAQFNQKLDEQLRLQNMTREKWQQDYIDGATAHAVLERELNVKVTAADAKTFYGEHPADFEQPEEVQVRHILLLTIDPTTRQPLSADEQAGKHKQIEDILKRARAGEDFAKLASEYSEDPGSKNDGGLLPPFSRGQMMPEFEAAAFSMETNQISDVVKTAYGYHIIKLLKKIPAKTEPYTGLDTKLAGGLDLTIRDALTAQALQAGAPKYLLGLRKDADVQILDPDLKQLQGEVDASVETNAAPAVK